MKHTLTFTTVVIMLFAFNIHAQRVTVDFEEYAPGFTLSNQLSLTSLGISFPNGLEVVDCQFDNGICDAGTDGANSGNNVGLASYFTEFNRNPIIIRFEQRQDSVTFYLKPAYNYLQMQVSIEGWADGLDEPISGGTANFNNNNFVRYKLINCDEVRIYAQSSGSSSDDNWLIIDDITFDQAQDVPEDETRPNVFLSKPTAGYESDNGEIPVTGVASDNVQLDSVEVMVYDGSETVYQNNFCGRAGAACPIGSGNYEFETTLDLGSFENGSYILAVRAVDVSGNEKTFNRTIHINIPDPPPSITVHRIEVNQAVQDALFEVDGPGTVRTATSSTPLLPERNTLVRYYLKTDEGVRYNYQGELKLTVFYEDGDIFTDFINPNLNGFNDVDSILPVPSETVDQVEHLIEMRADLGKTLNFVIREDILVDADLITLTLFEGLTEVSGQLQVNLWPPTELGINYYKIKTDTPDPSVFMANIGDYIDGTYPVSRLHQSYEGEIIITLGFDLIAEIAGFSDAGRYRRSLHSAISGRWPSLPYTPEYPHWRVILGVMDPFAGGNATLGNAGNDNDRLYGVASTSSRGNVGAHETGHLIGLNHAGMAHGECSGGGCEEFVNINGTLDGTSGLFGDFGIALKYDDATSNYNAFLIDPCPVADPADRIGGCTAGVLDSLPEPVRPFDMMSYGSPPTWGGFILDSRDRQWISTHNYRRIYFAIKDRSDIKSGAIYRKHLDSEEPDVQLFVQVDGVIKDDSAYVYGLMEKPIAAHIAANIENSEGDYKLIISDITDNQLLEQSFDPDSIMDTDECCAMSFHLLVPKPTNAHKVVIQNPEGKTIYQQVASSAKPSIQLTSDLGGQYFQDGKINISWDVSDADDDPLIITAEYSPDMGTTWIPLAYLEEPEDDNISVDVGQMQESDSAIIKLSASDGFHTSVDINSETFCVKGSGNCNPVPVTLESVGLVSVNDRKLQSTFAVNLYPNPAEANVNVRVDVPGPGNINIQVYDMVGKELKIAKANYKAVTGSNHFNLNTSRLSEGIYHVQVQFNGEGKITKRLLIK